MNIPQASNLLKNQAANQNFADKYTGKPEYLFVKHFRLPKVISDDVPPPERIVVKNVNKICRFSFIDAGCRVVGIKNQIENDL